MKSRYVSSRLVNVGDSNNATMGALRYVILDLGRYSDKN